eukprot:m.22311 g.22311  ORF g.22311 m.22311 type:complete len:652 (+) comp10701_c0_seq1:2048-4003(+)
MPRSCRERRWIWRRRASFRRRKWCTLASSSSFGSCAISPSPKMRSCCTSTSRRRSGVSTRSRRRRLLAHSGQCGSRRPVGSQCRMRAVPATTVRDIVNVGWTGIGTRLGSSTTRDEGTPRLRRATRTRKTGATAASLTAPIDLGSRGRTLHWAVIKVTTTSTTGPPTEAREMRPERRPTRAPWRTATCTLTTGEGVVVDAPATRSRVGRLATEAVSTTSEVPQTLRRTSTGTGTTAASASLSTRAGRTARVARRTLVRRALVVVPCNPEANSNPMRPLQTREAAETMHPIWHRDTAQVPLTRQNLDRRPRLHRRSAGTRTTILRKAGTHLMARICIVGTSPPTRHLAFRKTTHVDPRRRTNIAGPAYSTPRPAARCRSRFPAIATRAAAGRRGSSTAIPTGRQRTGGLPRPTAFTLGMRAIVNRRRPTPGAAPTLPTGCTSHGTRRGIRPTTPSTLLLTTLQVRTTESVAFRKDQCRARHSVCSTKTLLRPARAATVQPTTTPRACTRTAGTRIEARIYRPTAMVTPPLTNPHRGGLPPKHRLQSQHPKSKRCEGSSKHFACKFSSSKAPTSAHRGTNLTTTEDRDTSLTTTVVGTTDVTKTAIPFKESETIPARRVYRIILRAAICLHSTHLTHLPPFLSPRPENCEFYM